jgi:hypothetical protein
MVEVVSVRPYVLLPELPNGRLNLVMGGYIKSCQANLIFLRNLLVTYNPTLWSPESKFRPINYLITTHGTNNDAEYF